VRLKPESLDKLRRFIRSLEADTVTAGDIESFYGRLVHACAVLDIPLGRHYFAFKYCRRVQARLARGVLDPDDKVSCPSSFARAVPRILHDMSGMRKVRPQHVAGPKNSFNVYVDASLDGWGVVVERVADRRLSIFGGRWDERAHINVLEARGLSIIRSVFDSYFPEARIMHIFIDNTTVCAAARRQSCFANSEINSHAVEFTEWCRARDMDYHISWIASKANPADPPSRGTKAGIVERLHTVIERPEVTRSIT
jgi:hypothetical protein